MLKCGDMLKSIFMTVVFWVVRSVSEDTKPEESLDDRWLFYQQDGVAVQDSVHSPCSNNKVVGSSHSLFVCVHGHVCVMDRQNFESVKSSLDVKQIPSHLKHKCVFIMSKLGKK